MTSHGQTESHLAIDVRAINKYFGQRQVLDQVNFQVKKNTVHGFLGPNGAGKTTTMRIIAGLLRPSSGDVLVLGHSVEHEFNEVKKRIGILTEVPPLYSDMLVEDFLRFAARLRGVEGERLEKNLAKVMGLVDLSSIKGRLIGNLSKGNRQRVGVAQALVHDPDIIILDEPTSGLDPKAIFAMRALLNDLKTFHTIILSSHLLHEVSQCCEYVTLIDHGQIKSSGAIDEVLGRQDGHDEFLLEIGANDRAKLVEVLSDWPSLIRFRMQDVKEGLYEVRLSLESSEENQRSLAKAMIGHGFDLYALKKVTLDLEHYFMEMTDHHNPAQEMPQ